MIPPARPQDFGYRFPAEWEAQDAVWFAWPWRECLWPDCLAGVRRQLAALYLTAARFQTVKVLCPQSEQVALRALLSAQGDSRAAHRVELLDYRTDDVWIRDFGPLFLSAVEGGGLALVDWRYNAWGGKFPEQARDDAASAWIAERLGIRRFACAAVLEGGAIEGNGAGDLLTTEAVLLNPNRNGAVTRAEVEDQLAAGLGVEQILWLKDGLVGDDTDGHIDNLARFFAPDGILLASTVDPEDPNAPALEENRRQLEGMRNREGRPFRIVALPLPDPLLWAGERLAASYLNFVVLNDAVLVPTYGQARNDAGALAIIGDCFPGRTVIGVDCCDFIKEGGGLHCMSQQQPSTGRQGEGNVV